MSSVTFIKTLQNRIMNFIKTLFILSSILTIQSCQKKIECVKEMKFDKSLWLKKSAERLLQRQKKDNLLDNHKIKDLK